MSVNATPETADEETLNKKTADSKRTADITHPAGVPQHESSVVVVVGTTPPMHSINNQLALGSMFATFH